MPSNHTPNYNLNQWEKSDKVLMEDFNSDNLKIDGAIKAEANARASAVATLSAQLSGKGNCQIWSTAYTGTGLYKQENALHVTFPGRPLAAFIIGDNGHFVTVPSADGRSAFHPRGDTNVSVAFAWNGNTVTWYSEFPDTQMNSKDVRYLVIAFYAK